MIRKGAFVGPLEDTINAQLRSLYTVVCTKSGRILLPNMTELYMIAITFPLPGVSQHISLVENRDAAIYTNIQCRPLLWWEKEIFAPIGKTLNRKKNHTMDPNIFCDIYSNFLVYCGKHHISPFLVYLIYGLVDSNTS